MKGIIYKYTNQINNKIYIGQTINEYKRKYAHKHTLNSWRSYFHNAIKKYGYDKFAYEILEEIDSVNGNYRSLSRAIKRNGIFKDYIWKLEESC